MKLIPRRIITKRNAVAIAISLLGALLFFSIYDAVQESDDLAVLDTPLSIWAAAHQNPILVAVMRIITEASSPVAVGAATLVGAGLWMWRKKDIWRPSLLIGAVAIAFILSSIIKVATARARPSVTELINAVGAISYSFPSGHTIGAATFLLVIGYFACSARFTLGRIATWLTIATLGITLVAFSRIYLGYHWLTDVSASVGLALVIVAIVMIVDAYRPGRKKSAPTEAL